MRTLYIAYICSVLEYASPAWAPCLSNMQLLWLERIQYKAARIILGVWRPSRVKNVLLEANLPPLHTRYDMWTAYQSENLRCHHWNDQAHAITHTPPPSRRIQRECWNTRSDDLLINAGIHPARYYDTSPDPDGLISLRAWAQTLFVPSIPPWAIDGYEKITIFPFNQYLPPGSDDDTKRCKTAWALNVLGPFDSAFYTDASVLSSGRGSAASVRVDPRNTAYPVPYHPAKRPRLNPALTSTTPAGNLTASALAELEGLNLPLQYICRHPNGSQEPTQDR